VDEISRDDDTDDNPLYQFVIFIAMYDMDKEKRCEYTQRYQWLSSKGGWFGLVSLSKLRLSFSDMGKMQLSFGA
jgi:hypothetical protein